MVGFMALALIALSVSKVAVAQADVVFEGSVIISDVATSVTQLVTTTVCGQVLTYPEGHPATELPLLSSSCAAAVVPGSVLATSSAVAIVPISTGPSGETSLLLPTGNGTAAPSSEASGSSHAGHSGHSARPTETAATATHSASGTAHSNDTSTADGALADAAGTVKLGAVGLVVALMMGA